MPSTIPSPALTPKIYRVGTLEYTLRGIIVLFFWLLWGDFAACFFGGPLGSFLPLYLKDLQASNTLIGVMLGSIGGIINILFLPGISRKSDECRSRWGRRIPFLAICTPLKVFSLIMIGFAPEVGGWVYTHVVHPIAPAVTVQVVCLSWLCIFIVAFHYLGMVFNNAFSWLQHDVVPQEFMAQFLSWFRFIGTIASVAFSWYLFPSIMTHRKEICVGLGLFYLVVFLMMCWKVKEGEYPPVVPAKKKPNVLQAYGGYFRSCLSVPMYRNYFIALMITNCFGCAAMFLILFSQRTLGLSMDNLGKIGAITGITSLCALAPMGWLCNKFSAFKVSITCMVGGQIMTLLSYFFIHDMTSLLTMAIIGNLIATAGAISGATFTMQLFPHAKFGQFFAATNIFGCGIGVLGNYLAGTFMDAVHSNYRMAYLWMLIGALSLIPTFFVYRDWRRYGGPDNYVPPEPPE
ncbi:MAG: MFS transporter [Verrucomicrobiae bacterium]